MSVGSKATDERLCSFVNGLSLRRKHSKDGGKGAGVKKNKRKRDYSAFAEKHLTNFLFAIVVALVAIAIAVLIAKLFLHKLDVVAYLSAASTFAIALLTIGYVLTTRRQLDVMQSQLGEMKRQTQFQRQPYPQLLSIQFFVHKPVFTYMPPKDEYVVLCKYGLKFGLENIGESPAIGVTVMGRILVHSGDKQSALSPIHELSIEAIPPGKKWNDPQSDDEQVHFFSYGRTDVTQALRERDPRLFPEVCMMVLYKNTLNGAFVVHSHYVLTPKEKEQYETLTNWEKAVKSFAITYKHEMESLTSKKQENDRTWMDDGKEIARAFAEECVGEETMEMSARLVPRSTELMLMDSEVIDQYVSIVGKGFGTPLAPMGPDRCLHCQAERPE